MTRQSTKEAAMAEQKRRSAKNANLTPMERALRRLVPPDDPIFKLGFIVGERRDRGSSKRAGARAKKEKADA